jgi:hypothetical protein
MLGASLSMSDRPPYVFISYSHEDKKYAHRLAAALEHEGLSAWIDDRVDFGDQWPRVIEKHLDDCSAFIVIMTPRSYQSDWVQNELNRAKRKGKPIFPLFLEGDEPWLSVETTQYADVTDGELPPPEFYERLAQFVPPRATEGAASPVARPEPPQPSASAAPQAESAISNFEAERPDLFLWLAWALAGLVGGAVGWVVNLPGGWAVNWALVGTLVGVGQWLALRRRVPLAVWWWVLAGAAGWAVGGLVGDALAIELEVVIDAVDGNEGSVLAATLVGAVIGAVGGTLAGTAQWLLLRRQAPSAGWWVLASAVGWAAGWALGWALGWAVAGVVVDAVPGALGGAVGGAITGGALVWLLQRPESEA